MTVVDHLNSEWCAIVSSFVFVLSVALRKLKQADTMRRNCALYCRCKFIFMSLFFNVNYKNMIFYIHKIYVEILNDGIIT